MMVATKKVETREDKAKNICQKEGSIECDRNRIYIVESQTGTGKYKVQWKYGEWECNCPDFAECGKPCKHILAVKYKFHFEKPRPDSITYVKVPSTEDQSWSAYNAAQTHEMELFDVLLRELVSIIEESNQTMGRPRIPLQEQLFCCVKKVYSQVSSRRVSTLLKNAENDNYLYHAPHFNNISKTLNREDVTDILYSLVRVSAYPLAEIEREFSIDSSGFRTTRFNSYCNEKYGLKKKNVWLKAHISCGKLTNVVADAIITDGYASDTPYFQSLLEGTSRYFDVSEVSADKAYSSKKNHEVAAALGVNAYIPFKKNATGRSRGSPAWAKAYHEFQIHGEEFEQHYHKRSNVESTFAAIKLKLGETLKSKNETAQVNELLCKLIAYNITVLIHEMYLHGIEPDFVTAS